jgi:hypothetical protein
MVELVAFNDEQEAASIKSLLESRNIKVSVIFSPTWTMGGGGRPQGTGMICVAEEDVKKAMSILEELDDEDKDIGRMPVPIETPEDKLAWELRRLRTVASYKNNLWPGAVMTVFGGVVVIKALSGISDEPLKYALLVFGFTFILVGIWFLASSKQGQKAEKELEIKRKELKDHGHFLK